MIFFLWRLQSSGILCHVYWCISTNVTDGLAASIRGIVEYFVIFLQCSGQSVKLHLSGSHLLFFKSFSPVAEVGHCHPDRGNAEGAVGPSCLAYDLLPFSCIMYIKWTLVLWIFVHDICGLTIRELLIAQASDVPTTTTCIITCTTASSTAFPTQHSLSSYFIQCCIICLQLKQHC